MCNVLFCFYDVYFGSGGMLHTYACIIETAETFKNTYNTNIFHYHNGTFTYCMFNYHVQSFGSSVGEGVNT